MATPTKPSSEDCSVQTVLNAFDTLFNKRDYASAERFWSPHYIQHSCVYQKPKPGNSSDEVQQESRVNECLRCIERGARSAPRCPGTDVF
jgi:hypothetical protein